jgi:hypothetical protein
MHFVLTFCFLVLHSHYHVPLTKLCMRLPYRLTSLSITSDVTRLIAEQTCSLACQMPFSVMWYEAAMQRCYADSAYGNQRPLHPYVITRGLQNITSN